MNIFNTFFWCFFVDFEQVNASCVEETSPYQLSLVVFSETSEHDPISNLEKKTFSCWTESLPGETIHVILDNHDDTDERYNPSLPVTKREHCFQMSKECNVEIQDLKSKQSEADHRIAQHAYLAFKNHNSVCLVADNTDVLALLLYISKGCSFKIYFREGT